MHTLFPNKIVATLVIFLVLLNIFSWSLYSMRGAELANAQNVAAAAKQNRSVVAFQKLLVEKILNSGGEVDYNTRKNLDQAVNDTGNQKVISAWNAFLSAKSEAEGQTAIKNLLSAMTNAIYTGQ